MQLQRYRKAMRKMRYDGGGAIAVDDPEAHNTMKEYQSLLEEYTEACLLEGRMQEVAGGYA